jgi:hypothetical protein
VSTPRPWSQYMDYDESRYVISTDENGLFIQVARFEDYKDARKAIAAVALVDDLAKQSERAYENDPGMLASVLARAREIVGGEA